MTTTEHDATTTDEAQAEQTLTWSTSEEMFPVRDGATTDEINTILAKRAEYDQLLTANATQAETITELLAQRQLREDANARTLELASVAQKVLAQLSVMSTELTTTVVHIGDVPRFRYHAEQLGTFEVRLAGNTPQLHVTSTDRRVKPLVLDIDGEGLSARDVLTITGFMSVKGTTVLPRRAQTALITERSARGRGTSAGLGGLLASLFGGVDDDMSPASLMEQLLADDCGNPECPVHNGAMFR